ncbi:MAG: EamA family transporter [Gemmatimonadota bacterium]
MYVSLALSPLVLLVDPGRWSVRDATIGALAGIAMMLGLVQLYRGYAVARMGIVAPSSSVLAAAVPVLVDLGRGVRPGALATVGVLVGLAALALTGYVPGGAGSVQLGVALGVGSGRAFGVAFTVMGEASAEAGLTPIVTQRAAGLVMRSVAGLATRRTRTPSVTGAAPAPPPTLRTTPRLPAPFFAPWGAALGWTLGAGAIGICALGSMQLALRDGDSGIVSVAASQFGTAAVVLSVLFNGERMRWWQAVGVAATALGVALLSLG